jgi:cellulose synthase/poly-beta-1,6-N-acetylglucosamine synthase-like glycosyltransferase
VLYLAYLVIAVPYALLQAGFAAIARRRFLATGATADGASEAPPFAPAVDVIITCYAEDPTLLAECCTSVAEQDYSGPLRILLVDDGSPNRAELRRAVDDVRERYPRRPWKLFWPEHTNKRMSQNVAFRESSGELVVLVDSDTVLRHDAVTWIVDAFRDSRVGGACGNLRPKNSTQNLLTSLLERRYQHLFEQERGAQSRFGKVLCCSGPLSAYRRSALEPVWDRYVGQSFLGRPCVTGDDIHLTMLVLGQGFETRLSWHARAYTQVPASLVHYCQQQLRWQRSMYRELPRTLLMLRRWHAYMWLDLAARILLPFMLVAMAVLYAAEVAIDLSFLLRDAYLLAVPMIIYAGLVAWQVGDPKFLAYGPLHLLLVPFRLYAVLSFGSRNWITPRGRRIPSGR